MTARTRITLLPRPHTEGDQTPVCWIARHRCKYHCPSCVRIRLGNQPVIAYRRVCRRCETLPDQPLAGRGLCRRCYDECCRAGELDDWPTLPRGPVPGARYIPALVKRRRWNGWGYEASYEVPEDEL